MDKIPVVTNIEYAKYLLVCIGIINALSAYIFTSFKRSVEARLKKVENNVEKDHDKINMLVTLERERKDGM